MWIVTDPAGLQSAQHDAVAASALLRDYKVLLYALIIHRDDGHGRCLGCRPEDEQSMRRRPFPCGVRMLLLHVLVLVRQRQKEGPAGA